MEFDLGIWDIENYMLSRKKTPELFFLNIQVIFKHPWS